MATASTDSTGDAAVDVLPNEILAEILELCIEEGQESQGRVTLSPLTASHVSQHWRAVSIGTPALWSRISVSVLQQKLLDMYLARSSRHPLDIVLHFHLPPTWQEYKATTGKPLSDHHLHTVSTIMDSVIDHIDRCQALTFTAFDYLVTKAVLRSLENVAAPRLTSLSMNFSTRLLHPVFSGGTPMLTSLSCTPLWYSDPWQPLLPNLTSLSMKNTNNLVVREFRQFLSHSRSLTRLSLKGLCFSLVLTHVVPVVSDKVYLNSLRHLEISDFKSALFTAKACALHLFQFLSMPALQSISFSRSSEALVEGFVDALRSSTHERCPTLTTFRLEDMDIPLCLAHSLMHRTPSVQVLELAGANPMPSLLCSGSDFGFDPVWPELQILTLSRTTIESHLLSSVVQHRSRIGLPLQRVRIERGENWRALFDDWPLDVPTTLEFLG